MSVTATAVSWGVRSRSILDAVGLSVRPGEFLGLLGPNGSGKSSLLRLLAGTRAPDAGTVRISGDDLAALRPSARARRVAMTAQEHGVDAELSVLEVVLLGRVPYGRRFRAPRPAERDLALRALALFGMDGLAPRRWATLSGGERQRVVLARALTQTTPVLLLDEFTNHLDVRHQLEAFALFADAPSTVIAALHDLPLAATYCDRIALLSAGRVIACGHPAEVLTEETILRVYGAPASVRIDDDGRPRIRFGRLAAPRASTLDEKENDT